MRHLKILNAEKGFCRFVVCRFCRILPSPPCELFLHNSRNPLEHSGRGNR